MAPRSKKSPSKTASKAKSKPASKKSAGKSASTPLRIEFVKSPSKTADTAVIALYKDGKLSETGKTVDQMVGGIVQHQLKSTPTFKANAGQTLTVALPPKAPYTRIILLGLGEQDKMTTSVAETCGGRLLSALRSYGAENAVVLNLEDLDSEFSLELSIGMGVRLGTYEFEHYKTTSKKKKDEAPSLSSLSFISTEAKLLSGLFDDEEDLAASVFLTRNLVNEPPNKLYPESFAKVIQKTLTPLGVKVEVFDKDKLEKMGMGLMIAVGQASENPPALVVMSWPGKSGKGKKEKPLAFVGKGITFDTGGLCLKPYEGMVDMKMDMAGAAAVTGLMHALAKRKCETPVVGVVALAENSVSDEAVRPSDIITSYSGKTVEVLNTDAEGRLVLADALTYVQEKYDPRLIVDLATLTGAILVALGVDYAGAFVNDDHLWDTLYQASQDSGEKIWRMPLDENFRREMDSPFADIKNVGAGRYGGSSLGAAFLEEFIDKDRPWCHLDIAGTAHQRSGKPTSPKPFATGYGVRLLNEFVKGQE